MKLATRMTIAVGAAAFVLFGAAGTLLLRREERDLRAAATRETVLLGRSLQVAFENALRDRQLADVDETLEALSRIAPEVGIFVYNETGALVDVSEGARVSPAVTRLQTRARRRALPLIEFAQQADPPLLRYALRLRREANGKSSALVLERPLNDLMLDLRKTRNGIIFAVVAFVIAVTILVHMLTRMYLGKPLTQMIRAMRRIRSGDLRVMPNPERNDEVGEAQREFDALIRDLGEARLRIQKETDARRHLERGLQRADKLITLGQMSAVLAHEVGSPLQILEGRARALLKHSHDERATQRTATIFVDQTERITRIIAQMLAITRRPAAARHSVNPEVPINNVIELLEVEARRRDISFSVHVSGQGTVLVDEDQLQQVALNLMRNALDASLKGTSIEVGVVFDGSTDYFCLQVSDQGGGVPEHIRPHLFEPFFTTKAAQGGSGLGLSVVKSIVEAHGGYVEYEKNGHCGAVFRALFPKCDAPKCDAPKHSAITATTKPWQNAASL